jgi:hypothetical protein
MRSDYDGILGIDALIRHVGCPEAKFIDESGVGDTTGNNFEQEAKQELRWSTLCLFNQMYFNSRLDSRVLIKHTFYLTKKIITDSYKFFSIYVQYHIG